MNPETLLQKGWSYKKLDELGFVGRGKSKHRPRNEPALYGGQFPFIQTADIMASEFYITKYSQTYSEKGLAQSKMWNENTLCLTIAGENTGETAILKFKACFPDSIIGFVADPKRADVRFIKYYFGTLKRQIKSISKGATQDNLSVEKLLSLDFLVPSVDEQQKIAEVLSAYDELIENNSRRIQILEEMTRRIYEEWFVRFRFPGHENVTMIESELGLIPNDWQVKPLEAVCQRITDGSHFSPSSVEKGLPMASVKDMHDWGINLSSCRHIGLDDFEKLVRNGCKPKLNDVLIAKDGSYLKHIFVVDKEIDLVLLSSIAILRPNELIKPNILAFYLKQPFVNQRMKGFVSGVAIPRIVLKDFRQFKIVVPPTDLQVRWSKLCGEMIDACHNLVRKNVVLRKTRALLLPKLISGEIDVSNFPVPMSD